MRSEVLLRRFWQAVVLLGWCGMALGQQLAERADVPYMQIAFGIFSAVLGGLFLAVSRLKTALDDKTPRPSAESLMLDVVLAALGGWFAAWMAVGFGWDWWKAAALTFAAGYGGIRWLEPMFLTGLNGARDTLARMFGGAQKP